MKTVLLALVVVISTCGPVWAQRALVTAERASVRERPESRAAIVASVTRDAEVDVIATDNVWLQVRIRATGVEGFIPASFVRMSPEAPAAESSTTPAAASAASVPPDSSATTQSSPSSAAATSADSATPANSAATGATATRTSTTSTRTFLGRAFGGVWNTYQNGLQVGAGVAVSPFVNTAFEISADGSFMRIGGTNSYGGSVNTTFNFVLPGQRFTPFAGGGLAVVHQPGSSIAFDLYGYDYEYEVPGETSVALQILGGADLPLSDRRAFRGELRIQFLPGGAAVAALAGLSF